MTKNCRQISGFSRIDPGDEQRKSMVVEQKNINRLITKCNNRSDCSFSRLQGSLLTADRRLAAQLGGPLLVSESLIYWIMCVAWSRPLKVSQKCNNALSVDNSKKNRLFFSLSFHHDVKKNFHIYFHLSRAPWWRHQVRVCVNTRKSFHFFQLKVSCREMIMTDSRRSQFGSKFKCSERWKSSVNRNTRRILGPGVSG